MVAASNKTGELSKARAIELYRKMFLCRHFDIMGEKMYSTGLLPASIHTCIGQEAIPVGFCENLRDDDYVYTAHRSHGWFISKGAPPEKMMAELLGRRTGLCKGKAGSVHFCWAEKGLLGSQGIASQSATIAVGTAMATKYRKKDQVTVVELGDGGAAEGAVHEGMNMAAIWKLPVIFAVENNLYAVSVAFEKASAVKDIAVRAAGYNMPGEVVDGMDVMAVSEAAKRAVERARRGDGPTLLELKTYRYHGHSRGDPYWGVYRSKEEVESWMARDCLMNVAAKAGLTDSEVAEIEQEVKTMMDEVVEYAKGSPVAAPEDALDDLYA